MSNSPYVSSRTVVSDSVPARILATASAAWRSYARWYRRRLTARHLHALDDRMLKDIGLSRGEIDSIAYGGLYGRRQRANNRDGRGW